MNAEPERLSRLEEAIGFAQHDVDGLSVQVREAYELIARLTKRIDALERRLDREADGAEDDEAG